MTRFSHCKKISPSSDLLWHFLLHEYFASSSSRLLPSPVLSSSDFRSPQLIFLSFFIQPRCVSSVILPSYSFRFLYLLNSFIILSFLSSLLSSSPFILFYCSHVPLFFISSHFILSFPFSLFLAFLRIFLSHPFRFSSLFHPNLPSSFIPGPHTTSLVQPHPPPFLPQPLLPSYSFFPLSSFPIFLSPLSSPSKTIPPLFLLPFSHHFQHHFYRPLSLSLSPSSPYLSFPHGHE